LDSITHSNQIHFGSALLEPPAQARRDKAIADFDRVKAGLRADH
jgi:hypothetical protein